MKKLLCCCFFMASSFLLFAQNENFKADSTIIKKIADEVMINSSAFKNLRFLCKDIGPRLSGSANAEKAVYATKKMLIDAGADTVYLQPCKVPHWIRGAKEEAYILLNGKKEKLQITSLGNSEGTGGKIIEAAVIEVKSMDEIKSKNVKGKIVFINIEMNPTYIKTFRAYGESGIGRRSGPAIAAKYGAVGVMVRSLASNEDDHPHTGTTIYNDSFPKIPAVAISTKNANDISKIIRSGKTVKVFLQSNCRMLGEVNSFNVIGEIKGNKYPEQIITVGGH
ncbi:MAG: hypothetical protein LH615_09155 [Ferruginibacter sp.]|nr:hypothetical protein [Ferruginibacter sp.]